VPAREIERYNAAHEPVTDARMRVEPIYTALQTAA
jgi:hypothetical protein